MTALTWFTSAATPDTTLYSAKIRSVIAENRSLKRDGVKLFVLIDKLQADIAVLQQQSSGCDTLILEYQVLLARLQKQLQRYELLSKTKTEIIDLKDEKIGLLEHETKLLHRKAILSGVLGTAGAGGAAILVTFLILRK